MHLALVTFGVHMQALTLMDLLQAVPDELQFNFQPGRILCRSFHLHSLSDAPVAFKLKTNAPQSYSVKPGRGVVAPGEHVRITVYMQPQLFMPASHQFLLQASLAWLVHDAVVDMSTFQAAQWSCMQS